MCVTILYTSPASHRVRPIHCCTQLVPWFPTDGSIHPIVPHEEGSSTTSLTLCLFRVTHWEGMKQRHRTPTNSVSRDRMLLFKLHGVEWDQGGSGAIAAASIAGRLDRRFGFSNLRTSRGIARAESHSSPQISTMLLLTAHVVTMWS
jgi:hypothetical protein